MDVATACGAHAPMPINEAGKNSTEVNEVRDPFQEEVESLVHGEHSDPFQLLGPHWIERDGRSAVAIRTFHPSALEISIEFMANQGSQRAEKIHPKGLFEAIVSPDLLSARAGEAANPASYRLRFLFADGSVMHAYDTYAFPPLLTDYDLYLSGEGTHYLK
jgi:1,4-alpha-glucan branching enzyme